jgi:hypothetical protein
MDDVKTVRDLAKENEELYDYNFKWRDDDNPDLERELDVELSKMGYKLTDDCEDCAGEYNDIKGYFGCTVEKID